MSLTDVQAKISFLQLYDSSTNSIPYRNGVDFSTNDKTLINNAIMNIYSGSINAQVAFESAAASKSWVIYQANDDTPGYNWPGPSNPLPNQPPNAQYLGINKGAINDLMFLNQNGAWVRQDIKLTIAHELHHFRTGERDPVGTGPLGAMTDAEISASTDLRGGATRFQNIVAGDLGLQSLKQASYQAVLYESDNKFSSNFVKNISYTDGNLIDNAIIGDTLGNVTNTYDRRAHLTNDKDLIFGLSGNDHIYGGSGNDYLYGGKGADIVDGGADNDVIYGGEGSDIINGGDNDDRLYAVEIGQTNGIDGADYVDTIYGDAGDDVIWGGGGEDFLYGGDDKDEIHGGNGIDTLDGGDGDDTIYGDDGDDIFTTGVGTDKFYGGSGNNTFNFNTATSGDKTFIKDGSGTNTLSASENDSQITLDLSGPIPGIDAITGGTYSNVAVNLKGDDGYKFWDFSAVSLEKLELRGSSAGEYIKITPGDYTVNTGGGDYYQDTLVVQTDQNLTVTASGTTATGFTGSQLTYTGAGYFQGGTGNDVYYLNSGLQVSGGGGSDKFVLQQTSTPNIISTTFENRDSDTNSFYVRTIDVANLITSIDLFDYYDDNPDDIVVTGVSNTDHIITVFQSRTEASAVIWVQEKGPIWEQGVYGEFVGGAIFQGLWSNFGITINTEQVSGWEIDQRIRYGPDASYWSPRAGQISQADGETNMDTAAPPASALDDTFDGDFDGHSLTDSFVFPSSANQSGVVDLFSDHTWDLAESGNANFGNLLSILGEANHYGMLPSEGYEAPFPSGVNNAIIGNLPDDFRFV